MVDEGIVAPADGPSVNVHGTVIVSLRVTVVTGMVGGATGPGADGAGAPEVAGGPGGGVVAVWPMGMLVGQSVMMPGFSGMKSAQTDVMQVSATCLVVKSSV